MITTAVINVVLTIISGIFSILPDISWDVSSFTFTSFLNVVSSICYLLPINTISIIIALTVSFHIFRAVVSLIKTIWDLLPIL